MLTPEGDVPGDRRAPHAPPGGVTTFQVTLLTPNGVVTRDFATFALALVAQCELGDAGAIGVISVRRHAGGLRFPELAATR